MSNSISIKITKTEFGYHVDIDGEVKVLNTPELALAWISNTLREDKWN